MTNPNQPQDWQIVPDDPFGGIKSEKKSEAPDARAVKLIHQRSDVDGSKLSQHHTLGIEANQASPGDHVHDGGTSKKIGSGRSLAISGSKGGNAAVASIIAMLHNVIEFTDNTT